MVLTEKWFLQLWSMNPEPQFMNLEATAMHPETWSLSSKPWILNPESWTLNHAPLTLNLACWTLNRWDHGIASGPSERLQPTSHVVHPRWVLWRCEQRKSKSRSLPFWQDCSWDGISALGPFWAEDFAKDVGIHNAKGKFYSNLESTKVSILINKYKHSLMSAYQT